MASQLPMKFQCIRRLTVNVAGSPERGCVRSTSRSRFGVIASLRCCCDWLSAQSRSTDNSRMHHEISAHVKEVVRIGVMR